METLPLNLIDPATLQLSSAQLQALLPYLIFFGGICLALILSVVPAAKPTVTTPVICALSMVASAASLLISASPEPLFGGMLLTDTFAHFGNALFLACGVCAILLSYRYLEKQKLNYPEYYLLLSFSVLGMMLMASTLNLMVLFIALELMSLSVYVLVAFRRNDRRSNEAGVKYFILGSAASAILLYGAALVYGATLSVDLLEVSKRTLQSSAVNSPLLVLGMLCLLVGFLFKVASVPFHTWMPDVYDGAPTPITALMTTGLKAAVFITLIRVVSTWVGTPVAGVFHAVLWFSAAATFFVGNVVALKQTNVKRMLAYSSIAHTGYLLIGILAGPTHPEAFAAVLFYVTVYAIMNLGAFAVLTVLAGYGDTGLELADLSGLSERHPWLSFALACFLFSMTGLPPTAGFTAKYFLFYSAIQSGEIWLVVLAVLCSAIGAYYYLRVVVHLYMRDPVGQFATFKVSRGAIVTLGLTLALVFQLGLVPGNALRWMGGLISTDKPAQVGAR